MSLGLAVSAKRQRGVRCPSRSRASPPTQCAAARLPHWRDFERRAAPPRRERDHPCAPGRRVERDLALARAMIRSRPAGSYVAAGKLSRPHIGCGVAIRFEQRRHPLLAPRRRGARRHKPRGRETVPPRPPAHRSSRHRCHRRRSAAGSGRCSGSSSVRIMRNVFPTCHSRKRRREHPRNRRVHSTSARK